MKRVGYWKDGPVDWRPNPALLVDRAWAESDEGKAVIAYLKSPTVTVREAYFGGSWCRFHCSRPDSQMGSRDMTDGTWIWPEGLVHYVEDHGVRLPAEFVAHVMRKR